jgi:hypothetical protein
MGKQPKTASDSSNQARNQETNAVKLHLLPLHRTTGKMGKGKEGLTDGQYYDHAYT